MSKIASRIAAALVGIRQKFVAARLLRLRPPNEWSQIQSADALLLSKSDIAGVPATLWIGV